MISVNTLPSFSDYLVVTQTITVIERVVMSINLIEIEIFYILLTNIKKYFRPKQKSTTGENKLI